MHAKYKTAVFFKFCVYIISREVDWKFPEGTGITPQQDDFYHLMNGKFCGEAWDAVSRYVYTALQGGSIMKGWTNDDRMMITCCNDGTRPVIFKIERIDIPENDEEREWLAKQNFKNTAEDAYTG